MGKICEGKREKWIANYTAHARENIFVWVRPKFSKKSLIKEKMRIIKEEAPSYRNWGVLFKDCYVKEELESIKNQKVTSNHNR